MDLATLYNYYQSSYQNYSDYLKVDKCVYTVEINGISNRTDLINLLKTYDFIYEKRILKMNQFGDKKYVKVNRLIKTSKVLFSTKNPLILQQDISLSGYCLKEIDDNINLENIYKTNFIKIGGINYNNLPFYLEKIKQSIEILINSDQMTFIHGDLFLGNILFDSTSKIFKFIDPRGNFGDVGIYGDTKYDIAKLRHSFVGNYDFIVADLFTINYNDEVGWDFKILNEKYHEQISNYFDLELEKNGYDLNQIKFIEALLFISMVPLHSDNIKRQQAMYLTGILKLNELNI